MIEQPAAKKLGLREKQRKQLRAWTKNPPKTCLRRKAWAILMAAGGKPAYQIARNRRLQDVGRAKKACKQLLYLDDRKVVMNGLITLLGSGEYLPVMEPVDRYLLQSLRANGHAPRVACLPTAAGQEGHESIERWSRMGLEHFQRLGADVSAPRIIDRASADDPRWEGTLEAADLVYFSGGKPDYLYRTLQGSRAWAAIQRGWEHGAVYAGCSAGAMILAQRIPNFRAAGLASMPGFGIIPAVYVIPHFDRMRALWSAYLFGIRRQLKDGEFILGIDEDTALVGRPGGDWRVMGRASVHVITRDDAQEYAPGKSVPMPG